MGAWHRQGQVELRWATTWCPYAGQLEHLRGLPALARCLTEDEAASRPTAAAAKLAAALAVLEIEGRPLIWADDDAIPSGGDELYRLRGASHRSLLIAPRPGRGLSRREMSQIATFLEEHSA